MHAAFIACITRTYGIPLHTNDGISSNWFYHKAQNEALSSVVEQDQ